MATETMDPLLRGSVFKHWDNRSCSADYVVELVRKHLGSKAAYDKVKPILKTASWNVNKTNE
jgi:hypothetical protein